MVNVVTYENGWKIHDTIYYGNDLVDGVTIALLACRGEHVRYGEEMKHVIDFPGEYDIAGISIRGWFAKETMSYLVKTPEQTYALISHPAALDVGSFDEAEVLLCLTQDAADEAEKMELEGEIMTLESAVSGSSEVAE